MGLLDGNDPFAHFRRLAQEYHGNPFQEGSPEYRAFALGWSKGRAKLVHDVTTADPKKLAASFTEAYILMRPSTFKKRLKMERAAALKEKR